MSTSINVHVEVKIDGQWHHYSAPEIDPNYHLFTKLCGVRRRDDSIVQISEPRGIPDDVSVITAIDAQNWGVNGFAYSWISAKEAGETDEWWRRFCKNRQVGPLFGYVLGNNIEDFGPDGIGRPDDVPQVEDARVVFWFD